MNRPRQILSHVELFPTRTPTLPPATHTNSWALGGRDVLLVEPAPESEKEQRAMIAWVDGMRSAGRRPLAIVVTHHHRDHVGAASVLSEALHLPLWAHEATCDRLAEVSWERRLADGEILGLEEPSRRWRVLHTPGHAPGHVCLHEPEDGLIVLGDMIAREGTILIAPGEGDMRVYLEQLQRLAKLDARLGLPAHGEPIEKPSRVLVATHAHRLMREGKVVAALRKRQGDSQVEELLADVYDDVPVTTWPLARLSLLAHLEKLVDDGVVVRRADGFALQMNGAENW